ncbi:MAG: hypothetical protein OFPI_25380 [Osedax symbiont Rs2]|nr:MAG: hypothetical protein OFPI_25380 [Osedax symbiont Rs2]
MASPKQQKTNKAIILLCVILSVAAIAIISTRGQSFKDATTSTNLLEQSQIQQPFQVMLYYFPARKETASALTSYLSAQGYQVTMLPAATETSLQSSKSLPSHIFYDHYEFGKAMAIKQSIEKEIGLPMNAYKFKDSIHSGTMTIVLSAAEKDRTSTTPKPPVSDPQ